MKNYSNIYIYKRKNAFTIIELIVVITIIAILLAMSTLIASKIIRRERVESATDKFVSFLKEAQKYSMINSYYKDNGNIQKRHYGIRIEKNKNNMNSNEDNFNISLVWNNLINSDYSNEIKEKSLDISRIKIYNVPSNSTQNNNQKAELIDNIAIYFNDTGAIKVESAQNLSYGITIRIADASDDYKRDIKISAMGHINVESPK
jgi:prepilin-type N-terminal cleavage/methylation domain-containing protein